MQKPRPLPVVLAILVCLPVLAIGMGEPDQDGEAALRQDYRLLSSVMGAGGADGESQSYQTKGTLGQPTPIGIGSTGGATTLHAGFWGVYIALGHGQDVHMPQLLTNRLMHHSPNPFGARTTIQYMVAAESPVALTVFNVNGERVRSLVQETQGPGIYTANWNGKDDAGRTVAAGVYFCRVRIADYESVKKMMMIK